MVLKETILEEDEKEPRLTIEGQYMMVRPVNQIEKWLYKYFTIEKSEDIRQSEEYDNQRIWFLKKKQVINHSDDSNIKDENPIDDISLTQVDITNDTPRK